MFLQGDGHETSDKGSESKLDLASIVVVGTRNASRTSRAGRRLGTASRNGSSAVAARAAMRAARGSRVQRVHCGSSCAGGLLSRAGRLLRRAGSRLGGASGRGYIGSCTETSAIVFSSRRCLSPCLPAKSHSSTRLTNLDVLAIADISKGLHSSLRIVTADLGDLGAQVLVLARALDIGWVTVLAGSAKQTARRGREGKLSKREEGRGKDGAAEHVGG